MLRAAYRDGSDLDGRHPDADGNVLTTLAARVVPPRQPGVVADRHHLHHGLGPVSDDGGIAHRRGDLAVFDEIAFADHEHKVTLGDLDLTAGERLGVDSTLRR